MDAAGAHPDATLPSKSARCVRQYSLSIVLGRTCATHDGNRQPVSISNDLPLPSPYLKGTTIPLPWSSNHYPHLFMHCASESFRSLASACSPSHIQKQSL